MGREGGRLARVQQGFEERGIGAGHIGEPNHVSERRERERPVQRSLHGEVGGEGSGHRGGHLGEPGPQLVTKARQHGARGVLGGRPGDFGMALVAPGGPRVSPRVAGPGNGLALAHEAGHHVERGDRQGVAPERVVKGAAERAFE